MAPADTAEHSNPYLQAVNDFHAARRKATLEQLLATVTGRSQQLLDYDEVRQQLKGRELAQKELRNIPLAAIVGSVGRYKDFTRSFLPLKEEDKGRWAAVDLAMSSLSGVPPIEVYQIGEVYFVIDGNHRVSVARNAGATHIEAYVTLVETKVPLEPDDDLDDLLIKGELADFLERTELDKTRPETDFTVTSPHRYGRLLAQIDVQHHYLQKSYQEAAVVWHDEVYLPVVSFIHWRGMLRDFPDRTVTDLYVWVIVYQADLEEWLGWSIGPEAAAADLVQKFSERPQRLRTRLEEQVTAALLPTPLKDGPEIGQWREGWLSRRQSGRLFGDILVPLEGTAAGWQALTQALMIARREAGRVLGLHVVTDEETHTAAKTDQLRKTFLNRCLEADVEGQLLIEPGDVVDKICQLARLTDLVVIGLSHPPGSRVVSRLSSGIANLIRRSPRPILAVPNRVTRLKRLLLAFDGSDKAWEALFVAAYLASAWSAALTVLTVNDNEIKVEETAAEAETYLHEKGITATFLQGSGSVAAAVMEIARPEDYDLVLMGGYSKRPLLSIVLGSGVDEVLRTRNRPLLICR